jgi:hypothetical protein
LAQLLKVIAGLDRRPQRQELFKTNPGIFGTNIYQIVAKESSVANPQKVGKIDEKNQKNGTKIIWQHCFRLKQPMNYPIPWLTLVISATIATMG